MKPINEYTLQECLDDLRDADIEIGYEYVHREYRERIANRIEELTRWISVDERWPETEDVRGGKVLVYSTCGRYWKTVDGPQNN